MVKTPGFQCSVGAELIAGGEPQAMAKKKKREEKKHRFQKTNSTPVCVSD